EYRRVALANLDWALEQQVASGCFEHCAFSSGSAPFTHTIAYTLEGLLEAGLLLDDARYVDAARRGAEAALRDVRADGFVPGRIDVSGKARAVYACLVGSCQLALVWGKLHVQSKDERFRLAAVRALHYVMGCQELDTADTDVRGAIKGSQPVWAAYAPFTVPSWAAKFFVDATMQCAGWL
ncbi:MAG: hypothetical protein ACXW3T_15650, partial [Rhodoplanes sp.]